MKETLMGYFRWEESPQNLPFYIPLLYFDEPPLATVAPPPCNHYYFPCEHFYTTPDDMECSMRAEFEYQDHAPPLGRRPYNPLDYDNKYDAFNYADDYWDDSNSTLKSPSPHIALRQPQYADPPVYSSKFYEERTKWFTEGCRDGMDSQKHTADTHTDRQENLKHGHWRQPVQEYKSQQQRELPQKASDDLLVQYLQPVE